MLYNDPVLKKIKVYSPQNPDAKLKKRDFNLNFLDTDSKCQKPSDNSLLLTPHSAAYLDLDGDCMPDLFLTKQNYDEAGVPTDKVYEIYIQRVSDDGSQLYCLVQTDIF